MTHYTRAQIGLRAPRARYAFGGPDVDGIAVHWPAMKKPVHGFAAVMAALRNWQAFHMDTRGWSDIAYQEAVDQDGNSYELRGLDHQSGANGGTDVNERFGALLLILAPGEQPTEAMMRTARARIAAHRRLHPSSTRIVGHGQIRPGGSECPGPIAQRLIDRGAFEPRPDPAPRTPEDDDMPTAREIADALLDTPLNIHDPKGRKETQNVTVRESHVARVIETLHGEDAARVYLEQAQTSPAKKE